MGHLDPLSRSQSHFVKYIISRVLNSLIIFINDVTAKIQEEDELGSPSLVCRYLLEIVDGSPRPTSRVTEVTFVKYII